MKPFFLLCALSSLVFLEISHAAPLVVQTNSAANIRTQGSSTASLVYTAKKGDILWVLEQVGQWYRVTRLSDGKTGWIWSTLTRASSADFLLSQKEKWALRALPAFLQGKSKDILEWAIQKIDPLLRRDISEKNRYILLFIRQASWLISQQKKNTAVITGTPVSVPTTTVTTVGQGVDWKTSEIVVDQEKVKATWLEWYNETRKGLGLAPYSYDGRLEKTATEWSETAKTRGFISHKRDLKDGSAYNYTAITRWFAERGLVFKNVHTITHTENIGYGTFACSSQDCTQGLITGIRDVYDMYMWEKTHPGTWGRAHYESIVQKYFQIIGLGISISGNTFYLTVHYGTEILP